MASDSWQMHAFWSCPIAQAVRRELGSCISPPTVLICKHVWLLLPPNRIHRDVWCAVAAAALSAMDMGRRAMHAMSSTNNTSSISPIQTQPDAATRAAKMAAARFWCLLQDLADLEEAPKPGRRSASPTPSSGGPQTTYSA
jgi:hypothetical protein